MWAKYQYLYVLQNCFGFVSLILLISVDKLKNVFT